MRYLYSLNKHALFIVNKYIFRNTRCMHLENNSYFCKIELHSAYSQVDMVQRKVQTDK